MSWLKYPTNVSAARWTEWTEIDSFFVLYIGTAFDDGFSLIRFKLGVDTQYMIVEEPDPDVMAIFAINAGGAKLNLQPTLINGSNWWSDGSSHVYFAPYENAAGGLWVFTSALPAGSPVLEWYDDEDEAWKGDAFYTGVCPQAFGDSVTWVGGGSLKTSGNTNTKSMAFYALAGWESDTLTGIYTAVGGTTGTKEVGTPVWSATSPYNEMSRNLVKTDGKVTYAMATGGAVVWNAAASAYVFGTYGSASGWWQMASALDPETNGTLAFTYDTPSPLPEGWEPPAGSDIALTWDKWEGGAVFGGYIRNTADIYLADFARIM